MPPFLKAPGGLERDTHVFDQMWLERSVVSTLTYDREVGIKVETGDPHRNLIVDNFAITRTGPPGVDGGDPGDAADTAVITTAYGIQLKPFNPANINLTNRLLVVPGSTFAVALNLGARIRPDGDPGDSAKEPMDSKIFQGRPWKGVMFRAGGDAAFTIPHLRVLAEGGYRRDGTDLKVGHGNTTMLVGYFEFGLTPAGEYGAAADGAPLRSGWEWVNRFEGGNFTPPAGDGEAATYFGTTTGIQYLFSEQVRVQADVTFETFSADAAPPNGGVNREYAQVWATFRL